VTTYVRVRLGVETYALPVSHVKEVAGLGALTPVPGAAAEVLGVCNLRGTILAVYDLGAALGVAAKPRSRLVVAEAGGVQAGFAVDTIEDVADLPVPSEQLESGLMVGSAIVDGDLVGFIDVDALFDALRFKEPE
jgi:purine-binding chemotaxis protein CheW